MKAVRPNKRRLKLDPDSYCRLTQQVLKRDG